MLPSALAMLTRPARACILAVLALVVMPAAPAQAQSLSDLLEGLTGTNTSTTPAPAATTPAPAEEPAPTETAPAAPTATAPAAPAPPADATTPPPAANPTPTPPASEQPGVGVSEQPIAAATQEDQGSTALPAVLVALAVLTVLLLLGGASWALARWFAFDPRWLQRWRHSSREASYRASGVWADFTDWVKLGR